jgi:ADP-ribosylglycohydrolase
VWKNGPVCKMPCALQNALLTVMTSGSYVEAVRKNMMAGGDNCSRAMYAGALLAAQEGVGGIPKDWRSKTVKYDELAAMAAKVSQQGGEKKGLLACLPCL